MKTILVVDADVELLDAIAGFLAAPERTILKETDGYEALRILVAKPVDLLITDVKMSGITGFTLARLAKLVRPNLRVIYTAGYDCKAGNVTDIAYGPILQKPFHSGQLPQAVETLLAAAPARAGAASAPTGKPAIGHHTTRVA